MDPSPIIVSGSHRSGTTWVSRVIARSEEVGLDIPEPFNIRHSYGVLAFPIDYWFSYVPDLNEDLFVRAYSDCLAYRYRYFQELIRIRNLRDVGRYLRDSGKFAYSYFKGGRSLVKDPLAIMSLEWLHKAFGMHPVIMIRHPAAFYASLIKQGWHHPFQHFLFQPKLMEELKLFEPSIINLANNPATDLIEQACLLWRIIYKRVYDYKIHQPGWTYVRHEDISVNPSDEFQKIFRSLGLKYTSAIDRAVHESTSKNNPDEAKKQHQTKVNSLENVRSWQKKLSTAEIAKIRDLTQDIWPLFYADSDWEMTHY